MKKNNGIKSAISIALLTIAVAISGCAAQGEQPNVFNKAADGATSAAKSVGSAVGGLFQPYRNGVQITDEKIELVTAGMTASEVADTIGNPPEIESVNGGEVWSYPYSEIKHFGTNINETTVVRFDESGKVAKAYKTSSRNSASGNPLLDAANDTN